MDWRWPPTYGSGPFAPATPCTHVPGRYSGPNKFKRRVAHPWSWDIGSSTSAAQTSLNMVRSRRKARPFGLSTKLGLQENGRPSPKGTTLWPGPYSMDRETAGSASSQRSERCEASRSDSPSAWRRRSGDVPAPARTSEVRATVVNGWDVRPTLDRANANRRPLAQAAGSFVAGSPLPQALIQCRQRLTYELRLGKLVIPLSWSAPHRRLRRSVRGTASSRRS